MISVIRNSDGVVTSIESSRDSSLIKSEFKDFNIITVTINSLSEYYIQNQIKFNTDIGMVDQILVSLQVLYGLQFLKFLNVDPVPKTNDCEFCEPYIRLDLDHIRSRLIDLKAKSKSIDLMSGWIENLNFSNLLNVSDFKIYYEKQKMPLDQSLDLEAPSYSHNFISTFKFLQDIGTDVFKNLRVSQKFTVDSYLLADYISKKLVSMLSSSNNLQFDFYFLWNEIKILSEVARAALFAVNNYIDIVDDKLIWKPVSILSNESMSDMLQSISISLSQNSDIENAKWLRSTSMKALFFTGDYKLNQTESKIDTLTEFSYNANGTSTSFTIGKENTFFSDRVAFQTRGGADIKPTFPNRKEIKFIDMTAAVFCDYMISSLKVKIDALWTDIIEKQKSMRIKIFFSGPGVTASSFKVIEVDMANWKNILDIPYNESILYDSSKDILNISVLELLKSDIKFAQDNAFSAPSRLTAFADILCRQSAISEIIKNQIRDRKDLIPKSLSLNMVNLSYSVNFLDVIIQIINIARNS